MVDRNQRYLGSFHQRLKRAPIIKTTKSPSIDAAMRRLIVAIGEIVAQGLNACLEAVAGTQSRKMPPMPLAPGVRLGQYEALAPLGAGGMGADPLVAGC